MAQQEDKSNPSIPKGYNQPNHQFFVNYKHIRTYIFDQQNNENEVTIYSMLKVRSFFSALLNQNILQASPLL